MMFNMSEVYAPGDILKITYLKMARQNHHWRNPTMRKHWALEKADFEDLRGLQLKSPESLTMSEDLGVSTPDE